MNLMIASLIFPLLLIFGESNITSLANKIDVNNIENDFSRYNGYVRRVETQEKIVAFTFDADLSFYDQKRLASGSKESFYNEELINFLEQERIPATLFPTGLWIEQYPKITQELSKNPLFEIGNHSYSHPSFIGKCFQLRPIPNSEDKEEIQKTETLLNKYAPNFKKFFRFPGLCYDNNDLKTVNDLGYLVVHGDNVGGDGVNRNVDYTIQKVLSQIKPGSIIVLHMQGGSSAPSTAKAMPRIVTDLKAQGYRFVKVSELLKREK
ncbi:MAG: polysaccharide deacetylase family protein [Candidatus Parcubacteria bacterium]|nr:polysaccharide deacetylase family protein [Candidatus Parcubacteria bacterium]